MGDKLAILPHSLKRERGVGVPGSSGGRGGLSHTPDESLDGRCVSEL